MIDGRLELAPGWISIGGVLQGSSQRSEQAALEFVEAIDRHGMGSLALTGEGAARSARLYGGSGPTRHGS
jgi:hypothetical protein